MSDLTLVTGGAGFVGRRLVELLRARGERVRVFDLTHAGHPDDIEGSITDEGAVARAMAGVSSVFHLAGNAQLWSSDPDAFEEVNHKGTRIVAGAALKAGVRRFVHCSSLTTLVARSAPIGHSTVDETVILEPEEMLGPYPRSKLMAERAVLAAAGEGLDAVIAIPTEPLGAGDVSMTPPTKMILDFASGATPAYIDCVMNFVPTVSLAEGMIATRELGKPGERYILGGANTPMAALLKMIEAATGRAMPKMKMPYWVALGVGLIETGLVAPLTKKPPTAPLTGVRLAGRQVSFSSEKAANDLRWRASPVEPALRETLDWFHTEGLLRAG